jgi:hypothetical protein
VDALNDELELGIGELLERRLAAWEAGRASRAAAPGFGICSLQRRRRFAALDVPLGRVRNRTLRDFVHARLDQVELLGFDAAPDLFQDVDELRRLRHVEGF